MRGLVGQRPRPGSRRQRHRPATVAIAEGQPDRAVLFGVGGEVAVEPGRVHQRRLPLPFLGPDMQPDRGAAIRIRQHLRLWRAQRADHGLAGHKIGGCDQILTAGAQIHGRAFLVGGADGGAVDRLDKVRGNQQRCAIGIGPGPEGGGQGRGQFQSRQFLRQHMGRVRGVGHPSRLADFRQGRDPGHMGRSPLDQRDAPTRQQMRAPAPQQQIARACGQDRVGCAGPCRQPQLPPVAVALQARIPRGVQHGGGGAGEGGGDPAHALFAHETGACGQETGAARWQVHRDDGKGRSALVQRQSKRRGMAGQRQPFTGGVDKGLLRDAVLMQRQHLGMMGQQLDQHGLGRGGVAACPVRIGGGGPVLHHRKETGEILGGKVDGGLRPGGRRRRVGFAAIARRTGDEKVETGLGKERVQRVVAPRQQPHAGLAARTLLGKTQGDFAIPVRYGHHIGFQRQAIGRGDGDVVGQDAGCRYRQPHRQRHGKARRGRLRESQRDDALPARADLGIAPLQPECARIGHSTTSSRCGLRSARSA